MKPSDKKFSFSRILFCFFPEKDIYKNSKFLSVLSIKNSLILLIKKKRIYLVLHMNFVFHRRNPKDYPSIPTRTGHFSGHCSVTLSHTWKTKQKNKSKLFLIFFKKMFFVIFFLKNSLILKFYRSPFFLEISFLSLSLWLQNWWTNFFQENLWKHLKKKFKNDFSVWNSVKTKKISSAEYFLSCESPFI